MSVFTFLLISIAFCYVCGNTKAINEDDDFLQVINLANVPSISSKPYTPIQEQQKQQQYEQQQKVPRQQTKRSATVTLRTRQKRSQHDLSTMGVYSTEIPKYAHKPTLLNIMHTLRKQLTNIELARLSSRLSRSTAADLQLLNEIYNKNNNNNYNNNNAAIFNDERTPLNNDEVDNVNNNDDTSYISTETGNGGFGKLDDVGGVGGDVGATVIASNDMLANDIENPTEPWQFIARVSKKSSPMYKPRLGKRTQHRKQQQQ